MLGVQGPHIEPLLWLGTYKPFDLYITKKSITSLMGIC
jgi:hypothetical protein